MRLSDIADRPDNEIIDRPRTRLHIPVENKWAKILYRRQFTITIALFFCRVITETQEKGNRLNTSMDYKLVRYRCRLMRREANSS